MIRRFALPLLALTLALLAALSARGWLESRDKAEPRAAAEALGEIEEDEN